MLDLYRTSLINSISLTFKNKSMIYKKILKIMTESKPTHDIINSIHDDILKSINFELQKQAILHDSVISHDISEIKNH